MPRDLPHITAAELRILKAVWKLGEVNVRDVRDLLEKEDGAGDSPAYTTVMTLMNQLASKGALDVDRQRQPFVYKAAIRRDSVLADRLKQFISTVFDGQAGELVLRLVEESDLPPDVLKRLEQMIEAKDRQKGGEPEERR